MAKTPKFDLKDFLPYALNRAAEVSSLEFQRVYKERYGLLRTEWRVLFHLGQYGPMTAKDICNRASIHKTKVSRAVAALEAKRYLARATDETDRRLERLTLTRAGQRVFADLASYAYEYDRALASIFTDEEQDILRRTLAKIAERG